jgi:putative membrane protein
MKNCLGFIPICAALVALSLPAGAQTTTAPLSHHDKSFIEKAAKSGEEEVALSQIALQRAADPQVKEFAQMMVTDHTGANTELTSLASARSVEIPAASDHEINKWSQKTDKDFDEDYMEKMVKDHKEAVELFQKEADKGEDADLKAFAAKTLPALQSHLERAKEIKKSLK